ncbi:DUF6286 domain-containing protein [Kitasatospora sp. NPDC088346]|uniref:DUF6286 domain-containing protein n=1 Tax=Kitasatospora sp. NPDC088346 TaxID=3364073 RepID=UPI00380A7221
MSTENGPADDGPVGKGPAEEGPVEDGPAGDRPAAEPSVEEPATGLPPKPVAPRSPRTGLTSVVVVTVLVLAGALLYDLITVRTGHPASAWRARVARELADRRLDDTWVLAGAGVAVLLGLLLLWQAFAAGQRRWLPLRVPGALIDRAGVAALISDRATGLPQVRSAKVRVARGRTRVRITGAADPAGVQKVLRAELALIPLARPHRLDVRTRGPHPHDRHHPRPTDRQPPANQPQSGEHPQEEARP